MTAEILNEQPRDSEYESGYKKGVNDTIKDYRERRRKELAEIQDRDKRLGEMWTDEQVTKLVGNWMGELLLTHLKDNIHGKVNLTELAAKFHEYKKQLK